MINKISTQALFACAAVLALSMAPATTQAADIAQLTKTCAGCHGTDGASTHGTVPTIGGMSSAYIADTLGKYKSGDRKNCEAVKSSSGESSDMCKVAKDLSSDDMKALGDFFAGKKFVHAKQGTDAALAKKGKEIAEQTCEKCHTDGGSVAADDSGILSGQWKQYLKKEITDFRSGNRTAAKKMAPKIEKLEQSDIDALVEYFGSGQK